VEQERELRGSIESAMATLDLPWSRTAKGRPIVTPKWSSTLESAPSAVVQPPDMAPTTRNGSLPATTAAGNGASAGSCDRS
jgi:hypothetical protein